MTTSTTSTTGTTGTTGNSGTTGGGLTGSTGNTVFITTDSLFRYIVGNGLPGHSTGTFPNAHCPNTISAQNYNFKAYKNPSPAASSTSIALGKKPGVVRNSVPLDPLANEFWNNNQNSGWQYDPLGGGIDLGVDFNYAHVQPNGAYHYHGLPMSILTMLDYTHQMALVGWAADGYPIYGPYCYTNPNDPNSGLTKMKASYKLKTGTRPSGPGGVYDGTFEQDWQYVQGYGDLDSGNGRTGVTPEFPGGTYYYVLTSEYPYIPRVLKGTPDHSFGF